MSTSKYWWNFWCFTRHLVLLHPVYLKQSGHLGSGCRIQRWGGPRSPQRHPGWHWGHLGWQKCCLSASCSKLGGPYSKTTEEPIFSLHNSAPYLSHCLGGWKSPTVCRAQIWESGMCCVLLKPFQLLFEAKGKFQPWPSLCGYSKKKKFPSLIIEIHL